MIGFRAPIVSATVALGLSCLVGCGGKVQGSQLDDPGAAPTSGLPRPPTPEDIASSSSAGSGGGSDSSGGPPGYLVPAASSGCGKPLPASQVPTTPGTRTGYTPWVVAATGATLGSNVPAHAGDRQFFVRVPVDYEPNRPYRVVYIGQGDGGGLHGGSKSTYPLFDEMQGGTEQAVYVGLSVPDNDANPGCYDTNSGPQSQEWEAFDLIHTFVEAHYCVDNNRIYVAGYEGDGGGGLAEMWGCYFGGTPSPPLDAADVARGLSQRPFAPRWAIRGRASVAGMLAPNQPLPCNGPSAGIWIDDALNKSYLLTSNIAALNLSLQTNGCTGNYQDGPKRPWAPAENIVGLAGGLCQEYTGCPLETAAKYPLVFCTTGGYGDADQAVRAIPAFNLFFDLMNPE